VCVVDIILYFSSKGFRSDPKQHKRIADNFGKQLQQDMTMPLDIEDSPPETICSLLEASSDSSRADDIEVTHRSFKFNYPKKEREGKKRKTGACAGSL